MLRIGELFIIGRYGHMMNMQESTN